MKTLHILLVILLAAPLASAQSDLAELLNAPLDLNTNQNPEGDQQPSSGKGFEMDQDGKLEYHGTNLDVREVFGTLRLLTKKNIVVAQDVTAKFSGDLYDLSFDEAVEMICLATGLTASERGSYLYIEKTKLETQVFVLRHARAQDLKELITSMLGENEKVTASKASEVGIAGDEANAGGDAYASSDVIFVRATADNMRAIEELIRQVDAAPQQVLIEATILTADMVYSRQLGTDISVLQSLAFQDLNASSNGFSLTTNPISADQMANSVHQLQTDFTGDVPDGGLNFGFFRGDIAAFVRALQTVTDATVLAQPKVMALNKQRGEVLLGRRDGYLTTTVTETGTTQQVEFLETGTRLLFRPFIGDNELIRMEIHPEDSEGGLNSLGLPFEITAEVTTNILVRSGQTALIGGLFREKEESVERGVPGLSKIPGLGKLFGSNDDRVSREEIIVLLTPTIIDADSYGEEFASDNPLALEDLGEGSPALLGDMYLQTAQSLLADGQYGSAMVFLEDSGKTQSDSPLVRKLQQRVHHGLVPNFAAASVDQRILEQMMREVANE